MGAPKNLSWDGSYFLKIAKNCLGGVYMNGRREIKGV